MVCHAVARLLRKGNIVASVPLILSQESDEKYCLKHYECELVIEGVVEVAFSKYIF
jgi:hypothetical protein